MDLNQIPKMKSPSSYIEEILKKNGIITKIVLRDNSNLICNNGYKYSTDHNYCNSNNSSNCENEFSANQSLDEFAEECSYTNIA